MTLLELLVAMAIVALLAAIAYPSYRDHLLRAHRVEAIEALLAVAAAQERFYIANGRYAALLAGEAAAAETLPVAAVSAAGRYRLSIETDGTRAFVASARAIAGAGQERDTRCAVMALDAYGRRRAVDAAGADSTAACWR